MKVLVEKLKLKKFISILLLFSLVMSTFITSINSVDIFAEGSNDRRSALLNLGGGMSLASIDAQSNIDEASLQVLAIYLSNYYTPFVTILDGNYNYEDEDDIDNKQHVEAMKRALVQNCGMNRQAADFVTNFVLDQSLNSCKPIYIKKEALANLAFRRDRTFESTHYDSEGVEITDKVKSGQTIGFAQLESFIEDVGFSSLSYTTYLRYNMKNSFEDSMSREDCIDTIVKHYVDFFGIEKDDKGVEYVPVSYPVFLEIMNCSLDISKDYSGINSNTFLSNTKERLAFAKSPSNVFYNNLRRCPFYVKDSTGKFNICYSNSIACLESFLLVMSEINAEKGFGTSISFLGDEDVEAISCDSANINMHGLIFGSQMYVNWEGTLVLDTGMYRTPVVPGCINPHMFTKVEDTGDCYTIPLQNMYGVDTFINDKSSGDSISIRTSDSSFVRTARWRAEVGNSETDLDQDGSLDGTWGKTQYIHDIFSKSDLTTAKDGDAGYTEFSTFPWAKPLVEIICEDNKLTSDYTAFSDEITGYGAPKLNKDLVWVDNYTGVNTNTPYNDYFNTVDITSDDMKSKFGTSMDTFASFTNVTKLGTESVYTAVPTNLARCIFWTYCFAKFNEDKTTFDEASCIVDLKLNTKNFPTYNRNIDWSTLYADSLSDQVLSFIYYLLHPTEGIQYVATLLKNKIGGFLLRCHDDIVGSTDSNSSTGMTKYLGTSSYTTTSGLYDIEWIANILDMYNSIIVYIIIILCLIMLCYILTGTLGIQRAILGVVLFSLLAFLPPFTINATTNIINNFSDKIYSDKFDYWAITQLENYLITLDDANDKKENEEYTAYAAFVISNYTVASDSIGGTVETGYGGTRLKWMSPKKYCNMAMMSEAMDSITNGTDAKFLVSLLFSSVSQATSGETYLDSDDALYLYRDYTDIYRASSYSYYVRSIYNCNGYLGNVRNATAGVTTYTPLLMYTSPSDNYSSYAIAFSKIDGANEDLLNLIARDTVRSSHELLNTSDCYSLASSMNSAKLGFIEDTTIDDGAYTLYLHTIHKQFSSALNVSYILNYNYVYRYTCYALDKLKSIVNGDEELKIGSIPTGVGSNSGINGFNFGSNFGTSIKDNNFYLYGTPQILGLKDQDINEDVDDSRSNNPSVKNEFVQLSSYYYGLYSESPFYYFDYNIRDRLHTSKNSSGTDLYNFDETDLAYASKSGELSKFAEDLLNNNQEYFYNFSDQAGNGYGEMRDFMNMHDLFYYVIPCLKPGVDIARLFDDNFGLYMDDDLSLKFNSTGTFTYDGVDYDNLASFKDKYDGLDEEHKYKFWHSYNTFTILQNYTAWLDTMMDCDYAKEETINVMGEKYTVDDPLNPFSYFKRNDANEIIEGRLMVFSRSEMAYYGLRDADLTTVERKIIEIQDNVYEKTLDLMNYYTLSDETLITSFALIQLFEFNKVFSQESFVKESYTLYPQGYELKAFSYDAYLRMIISEASDEPIMTSISSDNNTGGVTSTETNTSIYKRVLENTSLFFALFLLINDVLAVYLIPGLKLFFIVCIFFTSIILIIASAVKLEMNMFKVMWKSLFAPLLSFAGTSMGMSLLVSMFMGDGANGVFSSSAVIDLGDPTSAIILMIIINAGVTIIYFKICKKCFHDFKTFTKAVFDNIGATMVGAAGILAGAVMGGRAIDGLLHKGASAVGSVGSALNRGMNGLAHTAKQRGKDNMPTSGKNGLGNNFSETNSSERGSGSQENANTENKYDKKLSESSARKYENYNNDSSNKGKNIISSKLNRLRNAKDVHDSKEMTDSDAQKYNRVGTLKNKVGTGVKYASSRLKSGALSAKNAITNMDNYAKAGVLAANIANSPRQIVTKAKKGAKSAVDTAKKGARSAVETAQIKGMYAMDAIKNAPHNAKNKVMSAVETAQIKGMYAMDRGKSGLRKARGYAENLKDGAKRAKKAFDTGYGYTRNR